VPLRAGENIVGRDTDELREFEAPTISRRHARIVIGESITLEDLGSKNGTWLKDERLTASQCPVRWRRREVWFGNVHVPSGPAIQA
jgi:pSer/pThr/pTyr-binding forkhead associated (FHA) protein